MFQMQSVVTMTKLAVAKTLDLLQLVGELTPTVENAPPAEETLPIQTVLGSNDEPYVRFLHLKGEAPCWPLFRKGKPNPLIVHLIRKELIQHGLHDDPAFIERLIQVIAGEALCRHHFDPLEDPLTRALYVVALDKARGGPVTMRVIDIKEFSLLVALKEQLDTSEWDTGTQWFSRKIQMRIVHLLSLGVRYRYVGHSEIGNSYEITLTQPQPRLAETTEAKEPEFTEELIMALRSAQPQVILFTGPIQRTEQAVDLLTKLIVCHRPDNRKPCGACPPCKLYDFRVSACDDGSHGDVIDLPISTVYINGAEVDANKVLFEKSKLVAAEKALAVVTAIDQVADDALDAPFGWIEATPQSIWLLTANSVHNIDPRIARRDVTLLPC